MRVARAGSELEWPDGTGVLLERRGWEVGVEP